MYNNSKESEQLRRQRPLPASTGQALHQLAPVDDSLAGLQSLPAALATSPSNVGPSPTTLVRHDSEYVPPLQQPYANAPRSFIPVKRPFSTTNPSAGHMAAVAAAATAAAASATRVSSDHIPPAPSTSGSRGIPSRFLKQEGSPLRGVEMEDPSEGPPVVANLIARFNSPNPSGPSSPPPAQQSWRQFHGPATVPSAAPHYRPHRDHDAPGLSTSDPTISSGLTSADMARFLPTSVPYHQQPFHQQNLHQPHHHFHTQAHQQPQYLGFQPIDNKAHPLATSHHSRALSFESPDRNSTFDGGVASTSPLSDPTADNFFVFTSGDDGRHIIGNHVAGSVSTVGPSTAARSFSPSSEASYYRSIAGSFLDPSANPDRPLHRPTRSISRPFVGDFSQPTQVSTAGPVQSATMAATLPTTATATAAPAATSSAARILHQQIFPISWDFANQANPPFVAGRLAAAATTVANTPGFAIWRPPAASLAPLSTASGFLPSTPLSEPQVFGARRKGSAPAAASIQLNEANIGSGPWSSPPALEKGRVSGLSSRLRRPSSGLSTSSTMASPTAENTKAPALPGRSQSTARVLREQMPTETWDMHKSTIRNLYLEERKPLKEVMQIMAGTHGFLATPKMYKTRFSQWGFVKNNSEDEVKKLLSMKFQRDAKGKVSEFVRNGRVVNLGTYLKRKGVTEYDLVDLETPADLPEYVRCRTPTPPGVMGPLLSPGLLRTQGTIHTNIRKAFLNCRQSEAETNTIVTWASTMHWGARSSEMLMRANRLFESHDADGGRVMLAFKQLEVDLGRVTPQAMMELLQAMVGREAGVTTALCKYLAAYLTTNHERTSPLRQVFTCLYEVQQKHGLVTLSDLVRASIISVAEELEAVYGRCHPYVVRNWADLAAAYGGDFTNTSRLIRLADDLVPLQQAADARAASEALLGGGADAAMQAMVLRYMTVQLHWAAGPDSAATRAAARELWAAMRAARATFPLRFDPAASPSPSTTVGSTSYLSSSAGPKPPELGSSCCYHCVVKVGPEARRCRERYGPILAALRTHCAVRVVTYFEEEPHGPEHEHAPDTSEALAAAVGYAAPNSFTRI